MSAERAKRVRNVLAVASVAEAVTGVAAVVDPSFVARLLLGTGLSGAGAQIGRCFGMAALTVGLACWPGPVGVGSLAAPRRGMLFYNLAIGAYLAVLGAAGQAAGFLLWPAVAYHALVALPLAARWRGGGEVRP